MTPPGRARQRGVALLLVLWIFMVLGVLALDFARYIRDDAMATVNYADETRGYYTALAGMQLAIFEAKRVREEGGPAEPAVAAGQAGVEEEVRKFPPDGQWHEGTFGGMRFAVRITDEGSRIPLNTGNQPLLRLVVENLAKGGNATTGVDRRIDAAIDEIVDSILDWCDNDGDEDLKRPHGAENEYYHRLPHPYDAKNAVFDSVDELLLVKGVTRELYYGSEGTPGLRELFSVDNRANVNLHTASAAVLQVVCTLDAATAADVVTRRLTEPGVLPIELVNCQNDPRVASVIAPEEADDDDEEPQTVLVEARADLQSPRNQSRVAAVVALGESADEGTKILRWFDRAPWEGGLPAGEVERGEGS